jgi:hypothetical protein
VVLIEPSFNVHKPIVILVSKNQPWLAEGRALKVGQELQMRNKVVSLREGSRGKKPQNLTPKFVEDMVIDVMESNKIT